MGLLNIDKLKQIITAIVKPIVCEELAKRGQMTQQKMFNRKQAAKYLGVSCNQIDTWRKAGLLDPAFPGGIKSRYYLREDLDALAEHGKDYLKKLQKVS